RTNVKGAGVGDPRCGDHSCGSGNTGSPRAWSSGRVGLEASLPSGRKAGRSGVDPPGPQCRRVVRRSRVCAGWIRAIASHAGRRPATLGASICRGMKMAKTRGRDQRGPMERLVKIAAYLKLAGEQGATGDKLIEIAGFEGEHAQRLLTRELGHL